MEKLKLVLFIDDDYPTNFYHKIIVRDSGLVEKYLFFYEAKTALDYLKKLADHLVPDAIFLDINMPEISGWEFIDLYEAMEGEKTPIYIMLTTELGEKDQVKVELNPLIYGCKNKPLTEMHLKEVMQDLKIFV